jgi:RNA polymerase sigma-70 factor (ECF subfamily)
VDTETDDLDLIDRSREGDLAAFNCLVERYQAGVYNLCLRLMGNAAAAEDAAQEAFIAAFRHLDRFRGGSFRAWLYRIAANACYDEMRRRKARPAASLDRPVAQGERALEPPDSAPGLEEHAANVELRTALESALARLPEEQRLAVILCDVQGFDYAEVAAVMQVSLGTVKSRISRARSRLREMLRAERELLPEGIRQTEEQP